MSQCIKCSEKTVNVTETLCAVHVDECRREYGAKETARREARLAKHGLQDLSKLEDIEIGGVDTQDYPDFCDAYISSASINGVKLTEEQLEVLNDEYPDLMYEEVINRLY